nr:ATP-dependent RNA helicase HrpA [Gammaproteobacteria bacterium]
VDIVPLYSRLSNAEQNRIFQNHSNPRIVLSTNVAETSLTVPGIRSVVDVGLARVSRYSVRSKVQRLPIEKISQASANQRKGRCGRVATGVCIRLYSEEDFESRAEFTEPEILRTNLSSVILQMAAMRLGSIDSFPFVEAPADKFINDGYRNVQELSALDARRSLTQLGRRLARLPIDPRLGRMLLAAADEGCVTETLTIVSALSVQDPRERPFDKREQSDELHAEFHDEKSDFVAWLNLWSFVSVQKEALSNSKFRKMCRQRFLSPLRIIEWMDVRSQLARLAKELKLPLNTTEAPYDNVHRALLSGLLANVATKTDRSEYFGTRNRHLKIFPGSGLFKRGPKWIMAGEIAETTQIFARQVAAIEPEWIESLAQHLLSRSYRDAHWQKKRGAVGAYEQSTLYGLIINPKKRVNYSAINPSESREIFIRDGLVGGALQTKGGFYQHNLDLLQEVNELEDKTRRRDIAVDPEMLVRFYDAIVPEDVCTLAAFDTFVKTLEAENPRALYFSRDMMFADDEVEVDSIDFPDQLDIGDMVLPLRYQFSPGTDSDGVTLMCPVEVLNRVPAPLCEWLVPGMLEEKVTSMLKALPKSLRRNFVPAPDFAKACVASMAGSKRPLSEALSVELQRMTGVSVPRSEWEESALSEHLKMRFEVIDSQGKTLAVGRDLEKLQHRFLEQVEQSLLQFSDTTLERDEVTDWDFGDLPHSVDIDRAGVTLKGYPALHVVEGKVGIKLFADQTAAAQAMPAGLRQLYKVALKDELRYLQRGLPNIDVLALRFAPFGTKAHLVTDIIDAAIDQTFILDTELPRTAESYQQGLTERQSQLVPNATEICLAVEQVFEQHRVVAKRLEGSVSLSWIEPARDIQDQIRSLLYVGFISATPMSVLQRMPLFFKAIGRRLDAIDQAPDKDRRRRSELAPVWESFKALPTHSPQSSQYHQKHQDLRWAFEELRISLFAQELGTSGKVSISRLEKRISDLQQLL